MRAIGPGPFGRRTGARLAEERDEPPLALEERPLDADPRDPEDRELAVRELEDRELDDRVDEPPERRAAEPDRAGEDVREAMR